MGKQTPISKSFVMADGKEITIETGKLATQAHGSVVVKIGDTMLLATVVSAHEAREGQAFFPLSVDYQEKYAAVGRVPGNFFRREARLSDYEILVCRLVDRAIRPLFPDGYMNETQVLINLISADGETMPDAYAALAVSAALSVSDIPWSGPISEVRVAKINGEYIVNPLKSELPEAELEVIIAATVDNIMMVEGEANECSEADLIEAIKVGHEAIKIQCQAQLDLTQLVGDKALIKREIEVTEDNEELKELVKSNLKDGIIKIARAALDKHGRKDQFKDLRDQFLEQLKVEKGEEYMEENEGILKSYFDKIKKEEIRELVMSEGLRLDGRKSDEVRPIWSQINYLPRAHGSAIFNRGETQTLATLTLGTKQDAMRIDTAMDEYFEKFILHYNFPALSVGEIKPMRGPGRREVGHANLAGRCLKKILPEDYPYTLRIVSDVLESNGSSSMATVCGGSLALMDAGVPVKGGVSGIAMGMISDGERNVILSDILGDEDALGDMDFKVAGTKEGICSCQMDIKIDGLSYELLEKALMQAKEGRLHILNEMNKTIEKANPELKPHAPRMEKLVIDKSFIGAVIGPGGKVIQEMQELTGTTISIEEIDNKGEIFISGVNKEGMDKAIEMINNITFTPEVGGIYDAKVVTLMPYGVFVDFLGKSGLLHISEISHSRVEKVEDVFKEGDAVKVKIIGIDSRSGKLKLSRKALMPRPERSERQDRDRRNDRDRNDRHRKDDRHNRRNDRRE